MNRFTYCLLLPSLFLVNFASVDARFMANIQAEFTNSLPASQQHIHESTLTPQGGTAVPSYFDSPSQEFEADKLAIRWELLDNNYNDQGRYLATFTMINNSNQPLPPNGWKIYFNASPFLAAETVSGPFQHGYVNGDLSYFEPTGDFNGLPPGETIRFEFSQNGAIINKTDVPTGLYWVSDENPEQGYTVDNYIVKPVKDEIELSRGSWDFVPEATPEVLFEENRSIRKISESEWPAVFPTPVSHNKTGRSFELTSNTTIAFDLLFEMEASLLSEELAQVIGNTPALARKDASEHQIVLKRSDDLNGEAYRLTVTPDEITITAGDRAGAFYGIQSLKTALPASAWSNVQSSVTVPGMEIEDEPRFAHRAFMLDVSRNFKTKEQVLKLLDLMGLYKLNVFHFHFNDDEGWRIEIPDLPELTEVGGRRGHTSNERTHLQPSYGSGPDTDYPGSGYYSREDFIEILKYATSRHIRVIPEIETPGHARAAIKAMESRYLRLMDEGLEEEAKRYLLQHPEDKSEYRSVQGWNDNVIDVSLPSTYRFLEKIIDELQNMYEKTGAPLEIIHMGGDEVPAGVWEESPAVKTLITEHSGVEGTGDLWNYFFENVQKILSDRGLDLYGWEEIGMTQALWGEQGDEPGPSSAFSGQNVHVDVWNNVAGGGDEDLAYRLANAGYKVVLSGVSNFYFDLAYEKTFEEPGLYWGGFLPLDKPFSFIPYDYYKNIDVSVSGRELDDGYFGDKERLTEEGRNNIVGIQSLLWGERLVNAKRMEYMLLPRLLAMAERAWSPSPQWATEENSSYSEELYREDWSRFVNKISGHELPRLDFYHGGFNYRIPTPGAVVKEGEVHANTRMPGFTIRYTTDGSEPTVQSRVYSNPVTEKGWVKLKIFNQNERAGRSVAIDNR